MNSEDRRLDRIEESLKSEFHARGDAELPEGWVDGVMEAVRGSPPPSSDGNGRSSSLPEEQDSSSGPDEIPRGMILFAWIAGLLALLVLLIGFIWGGKAGPDLPADEASRIIRHVFGF